MTDPDPDADRRILLLAHTGREDARDVARAVASALSANGLIVRMLEDEAKELELPAGHGVETVTSAEAGPAECELAVVIGGDGTILRAAELTHGTSTPLLGVNLGHVGFLAEAESEDVEKMIALIVERKYSSEERLTLDVSVYRDKELVETTWALNEASVEKAARQRMLEVVVEVDGRPLSRFGCDGVVCATPTGSTAYNFSAGGPIVWPGVEALLMVPISAHALFARPLVVAPSSVLAVEVLAQTEGAGVLWCDGRRTVDLPPGARIEVRRGRSPVRLVRLHEAPFTDRLVAKFGLPVEGWRGANERRRRNAQALRRRSDDEASAVIEEIRISSLGVIDESVLEFGEGLTVITGETGAGKTMLVTALGLLLGGRADTGAVRTGARAARVEGVVRADATLESMADEHGGEVEGGRLLLGRQVSAEGRSRAFLGGASVPASALARVGEALVAVHGQSDQHRLLRPEAQRDALDSQAGPVLQTVLDRYRDSFHRLHAVEAELREVLGSARERAREADLLRLGLEEIEAVDPQPGEEDSLATEETRLGFADTLRTAAETAREALSSDADSPDALGAVAGARRALESVREHDPEVAGLADRVAEVSYLLADVAADVAAYSTLVETDPARLAAVSERRAALTALTRKYGETLAEVLEWSRVSAQRLFSLDGSDDRIAELRDRTRRAARHRSRPRLRELSRLRAAAGDRAVRDRHRASCTRCRCRTPGSRSTSTGPRTSRASSSTAVAGASRPPASTTSSCCSPPTPAPSRGRSARAPPAVSSPG